MNAAEIGEQSIVAACAFVRAGMQVTPQPLGRAAGQEAAAVKQRRGQA
jgi:carbonic anhydrase/acetyltransferase-like protein (isoleucine patch superfamily)